MKISISDYYPVYCISYISHDRYLLMINEIIHSCVLFEPCLLYYPNMKYLIMYGYVAVMDVSTTDYLSPILLVNGEVIV